MPTTQNIVIDLNTRGATPVAFTHQGDTARTFVFEVYNNGEEFDVSSYSVKVAALLPADNGYYVIAGKNMATGGTYGNTITVTLPAEYTQKFGNGVLTLVLTGSGATIRPINIDLRIQKSADAPETIAGASDFIPVLQRYMAEDMQTYINAWLDAHPEAMQYYISGSKLVLDENGILSIQNDTDEIVEALDLDTLRADVTDLKSDLKNTDNELFTYEYTPSSIAWEQGGMYSSSGTKASSTTRLRTVDRFSRPAGTIGIKAAAGYKYVIYVYDPNQSELNGYVGVFQPGGVYVKANAQWMTDITFFADIPTEYTFVVVIAKTDDGTITAADYTGCLIAVSKFLPIENSIANVYKTGAITPILDNLSIKTKNVFDSFAINSGSFSFTVGVSNISNYTDYATASSVSKNTPPIRIRDFNGELIYKNLRLNLDKESKPTTCMWLFDKNGYYLRAVTHSQFYHRTDVVNYFKEDEYFAIFNLFPSVPGYQDYAWIVDNVNIEWLNAKPEYHVGVGKEFTTFNGMLTALTDDPREKIVYIEPGEYDIFDEYGGAEYMASLADTAASMNWRDVCKVVPPNTHIIGLGSVTLKWIATAEEMQNSSVVTLFSPLNVSGNCTIENIKVVGQNCRYAVHDETSGLVRFDGSVHHYKKCYFECLQSTYGATTPYGSGHNKNMSLIFDDCEFVNYQNNAWATHHQAATAIEKATIIFNHCIFRRSKTGSDFYVQFTTDKTNGLKDEVRFNNCYIAAKIKFYTASSSEVQQGYDVTLVGSSQVKVVYSANVTTRYDVRQLNAVT